MKTKTFIYLAILGSMFAFTGCLEEEPNPAAGIPSPIIAIEDVRWMYRGQDITLQTDNLSGAHQIVGVVISDAASKNVPAGTVVIQNKRRRQTRGIMLSLGASTQIPFAMGDSVVVDITGGTLTTVNGSKQITGLALSDITKVAEGITVVPNEVTAAELLTRPDVYESTLVTLGAGTISPLPVSGEVYNGDKNLTDGSTLADNTVAIVQLHTEAGSTLANRRLPASAAFTGIPILYNANSNSPEGATLQLWMRNQTDAANASGPIYLGWPENFDAPSTAKGSYNMNTADVPDNTISFATGAWKLYQTIYGKAGNDEALSKPNAIRMQQNLSEPALLEMKFDVPNGASKVTLWPMIYDANADKPCKWRLEYSQDQGTTWTQIGEDQFTTKKDRELYTFLMDIQGPVRFRIYKYGPGSSATDVTIQNGRLSVDDFAIYENPN